MKGSIQITAQLGLEDAKAVLQVMHECRLEVDVISSARTNVAEWSGTKITLAKQSGSIRLDCGRRIVFGIHQNPGRKPTCRLTLVLLPHATEMTKNIAVMQKFMEALAEVNSNQSLDCADSAEALAFSN